MRTTIPARPIRMAAAAALLALTTAALAACEPPPEPWWPTVRTDDLAMDPGYEAVVGDFDGDGYDDILWYDGAAAGDPVDTVDLPEAMWLGRPDGRFARTAAPAQVHGIYTPIVMQLDGAVPDDIIWYSANGPSPGWVMAAGGTIAERWTAQLARRSEVFLIDNTGRPDTLGFRLPAANGHSIVVWHATQYPEEIWLSLIEDSSRSHPVAGDFDGDGWGDVFLYRPGSAADAVAWHTSDTEPTPNVHGTYNPVAADVDGDERDDIVFANPSTEAKTPVWSIGPGRTVRSRSYQPIGERFRPPVQRATVPGGRDAIPLFHVAPDVGPLVWRVHPDGRSGNEWTGAEPISPSNLAYVLGHFSDGIREDVLVYDFWDSGAGNRLLLSPRATA